MAKFDREKHWEKIYKTKKLEEVSWYQESPEISVYFLKKSNLPQNAKIIDIGGGDSFFVDRCIELGYTNISVLDISSTSIERAKKRLGDKASMVTWIVEDTSKFKPSEKFDFWHDRAAFHFLSSPIDIIGYKGALQKGLNTKSSFVLGTFSTNGPTKCSGIDIKQYSKESMEELFQEDFLLKECKVIDHTTPSGSVQNFIFCAFQRKI